MEECLKEIIWRSSISQSLKGIATAGFVKSIQYSTTKIMKMLQTSPQITSLPKLESSQSKVERIMESVKNETQSKETDKRVE